MKSWNSGALIAALMMVWVAGTTAEPLVREEGEGSVRWILEAPRRVESFRLKTARPDAPPEDPPSKRVGTYVIDHAGPALTLEQSAEAAKLLLRVERGTGPAKACDPQPGVALRFVRGGHTFEAAICFECTLVVEYVDDKTVKTEDFTAVRAPLLKLLRLLFPKDAAIQGIKAEGESVGVERALTHRP